MRSGLATSRCPRSASTRITRSLSSMGRGRTRIATSMPSPTTSTRRLVASRCSVTPGIARHKSRQHRSDMDMQQGDRTGDPDATARLGAQRLDRLLRRLGLNQHRFAMLIKGLPDLGDRELTGGSLNQTHAQPLLELRNAAAEFGFRLVKRSPRRGETAMVYHRTNQAKSLRSCILPPLFHFWNSIGHFCSLPHTSSRI